MKIRSKLLLSNLIIGLIALAVGVFLISQLFIVQTLVNQEMPVILNSLSSNIKTNGSQPELVSSMRAAQDISSIITDSVARVILGFILGAFAFCIAAFLFSWNFAKYFVKPLKELSMATQEIIIGNLDRRAEVKSKDEFKDMADYFNIMANKLKRNIESIEQKVKDRTKDLEVQQKATFEALQDVEEEKAETRALLTAIGDGVIATDISGMVVFMNPTAEELLGWKVEEVLGRKIYDFLRMVDENDQPMEINKRPVYLALKIGQKVTSSVQKTYYYIKRNGEKLPVSISVTPVVMKDKMIGAINVFRDIIQEKRADKAKTEFVSLASHQLRTPLSAINWYTEMLLDGDAGKLTKQQKQYLLEVRESNRRMVILVGSLLNVSRIDLGTFAITPEMCEISLVAKRVLSEIAPAIKAKSLKVEENYDKNVEKISADPQIMTIILQNLLTNAVKYTPEKGNIRISTEKQAENVLIGVKDTGYGIPKKDQGKIFEKLFRASNVKDKETDGTGLGLYIIKSIVDQFGGKIWFVSEENKGTAFYVTIPLSGMKTKSGTKALSQSVSVKNLGET